MDDGKINPVSSGKPEKSAFAKKLKARKEFLSKYLRAGGRCLDAIWDRTDLTTGERAVLQQIASFHDYRSNTFVGPVKLSQRLIQDRCNMSDRGVQKALKTLEEKKLITVTRFKGGKGSAASESEYRLTGKLFRDHFETLAAKGVQERWLMGYVEIPPNSVREPKNTHEENSLQKGEVSQNPPELSSEGKNTHQKSDDCNNAESLGCVEIPPNSVRGTPRTQFGAFIPKRIPKKKLNPNPPISPQGGESVKGRGVKRADQANARKLFSLCTNAYGHWRAMYDRSNRSWVEGLGLGTPDEILKRAYPKLVTDLMGVFGPQWSKGTGRQAKDASKPDWNHWLPKLHTELLRVNGYSSLGEVESAVLHATLDQLIEAISARNHPEKESP